MNLTLEQWLQRAIGYAKLLRDQDIKIHPEVSDETLNQVFCKSSFKHIYKSGLTPEEAVLEEIEEWTEHP